jgi:hypothetical protein
MSVDPTETLLEALVWSRDQLGLSHDSERYQFSSTFLALMATKLIDLGAFSGWEGVSALMSLVHRREEAAAEEMETAGFTSQPLISTEEIRDALSALPAEPWER